MGSRPPITPFKADPDVRDEPKWIVMKRESPDDPWVPFTHHKSGKAYRYGTMDLASSALKNTFFRRWQAGNAKIEREDRVEGLL